MLELDLLCKLEKHNNSLEIYNTELKKISKKTSIREIEKNIIEKENQEKQLTKRKESITLELRKLEQKLKGYAYEIEELDTKLYNGETKDINQLEKWSIERENISNIINDAEFKALEFMEEIEKIKEDLIIIRSILPKIKNECKDLLKKQKEIENSLNAKIGIENKNIDKLEKALDEKLLNRYKLIRKNKKTAVAEVKNNICSGCNITISTYILENMKRDEEIAYCELCGRILYKE